MTFYALSWRHAISDGPMNFFKRETIFKRLEGKKKNLDNHIRVLGP